MDNLKQTEEVRSIESRRKAFLTLGETIAKLQEFVKPKHNVHHAIKSLVASIRKQYDDYAAEAEEPIPSTRPETVAIQTQTSPGLTPTASQAAPETTPTHRRKRAARKRKKIESPDGKEAKRAKSASERIGPSSGGQLGPITPAVTEGEKTQSQTDWRVATKRRASRGRSSRPDFVIVKATEGGLSYADILKKLKSDPSLEEVGSNVAKVRRNAAGHLLLELGKGAEAIQVSETISKKLGDSASVVSRMDEMTLEIRDLDELTTSTEVCEALGKRLGTSVNAAAVKSIRKAYKGTQTAVVRLPANLAKKAVENGRLRIGWVNCNIREKADVRKCYRCWAFGHLARNCKGTDRSKCCLRCGEVGHNRNDCKSNEARCVLCKDNNNHPTGSFGCPAYQTAVKTAKSRR